MTRYLFLISMGLFFCTSCTDTNTQSSIPYSLVRLSLDLKKTEYLVLQQLGASVAIKNRINETDQIGFGGVLIGQSIEGTYFAFDLACPVEASKSTLVTLKDPFSIVAICPTCKEEYVLSYGNATPQKGVSKETLKRYKVTKQGLFLSVSN